MSSGVRRVGRSATHLLLGRLVYLAFVEGSVLLSLCPRIHGVRVHHWKLRRLMVRSGQLYLSAGLLVDRHDHRPCRCSVWRSPAGPQWGRWALWDVTVLLWRQVTPLLWGHCRSGEVTRSFSSAALQITRPESSWILSLLAGFLVISQTARNSLAPSWRCSTSEARWFSLTDVNVKYLYCSTQHRERKIVFSYTVLPVW